ncbi:PVC-type heme-binding CxxCH protein [Prosthecobacter sp.]|uniref:PVC-type heme-binding CxxCH protein n=1 Tax=Prosthecobacter sp. TaxID=1965333 RepID=UPI002AB88692|nr:PVC-type heme-binding CxxCH protein [Prosthecobacter sp.]MDZ4402234.1 PVC-type heme-binding CxxCH protein [Prosthecobacter sp.]
MSFSRAALLVLGLNAALHAADTRLVRETEALTPAEEQTKLHVPPGFEVQLFASEPQINKPINMAFDARGRLWVSSTVEYPYAADKGRWSDPQGTHVKGSRDAIKILEDTDGDGHADKVTDFANELNIPTGVLPWHKPEHKAGCIAWSIPNIWYFADTNGDDIADHREILFGPLGYEKDTHGMCSSFRLGLDGWVYATHGFNNTSQFKAKDGSTLELHSGNVFRFKPDGSRVEAWTHGQVNPFGLAWDRYGNLYSADCHSSPIYQLIRGAHYPSFGKPHDGLGFAPVMCQHTHGSTGICGIVYIDGGVWGPEWDDHTFVGNVVTSKVNHDHVTFIGSTPKANEQPDFLTSDDPWFRPVDLQLGPDNALYIADFYNKIIGHYEVPLEHPGRDKERGRIWRIVKTSGISKRQPPPQVDITDWRSAVQNPSPFVQRVLLAKLQDQANLDALPSLIEAAQKTPADDTSLTLAYRIAVRDHLQLPGAFGQIDTAAHDQIADIAIAVPTAEASAFLFQRLQSGAPITPTILAHIARNGDSSLLTQAIATAKQSSLQHSNTPLPLVQALHDGLSERSMSPPPGLLAWAQELATQLLDSTAKQPTPAWTTLGGAKWSLQPRKLADDTETTVLQSIIKGGGDEESRTGTLKSQTFPAPAKLTLWINGHRGFPKAEAHEKNLVRVIDAETGRELARAFPPRNDTAKFTEFDLAAHAGKSVRLEIIDGDDGKAYAWLGITRIEPAVVSVNDFQSADTTRENLKTLAVMLQHSAPAALREKLAVYMPPRPATPPLPVSPEQRKQLDALIAQRVAAFAKAKPDMTVGKNVFTMTCAVCHQIGGQGGLIGPQLDGIGARGAARLCEDILDPNRNVDAHFHLHTLTMNDGSIFGGFLKAELGQIHLLADATGKEHRIAKKDIAKTSVTPISLMPPTFGQTLDEATFIDLLGYLLNEKAAK